MNSRQKSEFFFCLFASSMKSVSNENVLMVFDNQWKFDFPLRRGNSFTAFFATRPVNVYNSTFYCTFCFYDALKRIELQNYFFLQKDVKGVALIA